MKNTINNSRLDITWAYAAQVLSVGTSLLILPAAVRYLPSYDLALWFVFITLVGLVQLLELGFQPTLSRNISYVYAGAQNINHDGLPDIKPGAVFNSSLFLEIFYSARIIYACVTVVASIVLMVLCSLYIRHLLVPEQDLIVTLAAWVIFASGYIINFYYCYYNALLLGSGNVVAVNKVIIASRLSFLVLSLIFLICDLGLMGLAIASLVSSIIGRALSVWFFSLKNTINVNDKLLTIQSAKKTIKKLWHNSARLGAVNLGAFLILRGNLLIASTYLGLKSAASYGITLTIFIALSGVAMVACQFNLPRMNRLQASGERVELKKIYYETVLASCLIFSIGSSFIFFFGNDLLRFIESKTLLVSDEILVAFCLIFFLEVVHTVAATYLTTVNKVPFLRSALYSGIAVLILSMMLVKPLDILGLLIAQGVVQLSYNNWKWPLEAYRNLGGGANIKYSSIVKRIFADANSKVKK